MYCFKRCLCFLCLSILKINLKGFLLIITPDRIKINVLNRQRTWHPFNFMVKIAKTCFILLTSIVSFNYHLFQRIITQKAPILNSTYCSFQTVSPRKLKYLIIYNAWWHWLNMHFAWVQIFVQECEEGLFDSDEVFRS